MMHTSAVRIGRTHRLLGQNCQDFAGIGEPKTGFCFGLVCDGCGSKYREGKLVHPAHNEVGARLLGVFMTHYLDRHLSHERAGDEPLKELLGDLFQACLRFLSSLLEAIPFEDQLERAGFVATHLLSTVAGYVMTPQSASFFWSGDGYLCLDGQITTLDSQNRPQYLAYGLLADDKSGKGERDGFATAPIPSISEAKWLAVATDGWSESSLKELANPRSGTALQRWLNVQARGRGQFDDDAAVAAWYREPL